MIRVVADEKIAYAREALGTFGELVLIAGTELGSGHVRDADALIVRSVTRVGEALLAGSRVRLVGTASAGVDHIDEPYLDDRGIVLANASGANARAVAEYVVAAIYGACKRVPALAGSAVGVVGHGHVGGCVTEMLRALGWEVLVHDPPLERTGAHGESFVAIERILSCPIVTLHVPLTQEGLDPTHHLIGAEELAALAPGALLVNTSRGPVVDNAALDLALTEQRLHAVLDVWEGEPELRWSLLDHPSLLFATPHVAGHTRESKVAVTRMMHEAIARLVGEPPSWTGADVLPSVEPRERGELTQTLLDITQLPETEARLRGIRDHAPDGRAQSYEALRSVQTERRELAAHAIDLLESNAAARVFVGTSGYSYKQWKGGFYPSDLSNDRMLEFYARHFSSVEINNTFYRMPRASVLERWAEMVPPEFQFVFKAHRRITHQKRLRDPEDNLTYLLEQIDVLGDKLGPILFQLSPTLRKDSERLAAFLSVVPRTQPIAFEFRNDSWFDDEIYELLHGAGAALCAADYEDDEPIANEDGTPRHQPLVKTTDWGYVRLRREAYTEDELAYWVGRVRETWSRAFVFFMHEDEGEAPVLAQRFAELIAEPPRP